MNVRTSYETAWSFQVENTKNCSLLDSQNWRLNFYASSWR